MNEQEKRLCQTVVSELHAAYKVITEFLRELRPDLSEEALWHNTGALVARLAAHDPPITLDMSPEVSTRVVYVVQEVVYHVGESLAAVFDNEEEALAYRQELLRRKAQGGCFYDDVEVTRVTLGVDGESEVIT